MKDRRWIKREYDEFKVRINGLPDAIRRRCDAYHSKEEIKERRLAREKNGGVPPVKPVEVPKATWMTDGTHWPGTWYHPTADHSKGDHAGILQVSYLYYYLCMEGSIYLASFIYFILFFKRNPSKFIITDSEEMRK